MMDTWPIQQGDRLSPFHQDNLRKTSSLYPVIKSDAPASVFPRRIFFTFIVSLLTLTIGCGQANDEPQVEAVMDDAASDSISRVDDESEREASKPLTVDDEEPPRLAEFESSIDPLVDHSVNQVSTSVTRNSPDEAEHAFQELVASRLDSNPERWEQAEKNLERLGKSAIPTLIKALTSEEVEVRELATMWLVQFGTDSKESEKGLLSVLEDESAFVRVNAASGLSHLPEYADRVVPVLTELLSHAEFSVRITAATALGNAGEHAVSAVPALAESLLGEEREEYQLAVLTTLERIGPPAKEALKPIGQLYQSSESEEVKAAAKQAFEAIQVDGE